MSSDSVKVFTCSMCDFTIQFDCKGKDPRYMPRDLKYFTVCFTEIMIFFIRLLESVYCVRDPFVDDNLGGLIIGSDCSVCRSMVCTSQVG